MNEQRWKNLKGIVSQSVRCSKMVKTAKFDVQFKAHANATECNVSEVISILGNGTIFKRKIGKILQIDVCWRQEVS